MVKYFKSAVVFCIVGILFLGCEKDPIGPGNENECNSINGRYAQVVFSAIDSLVDIEYGKAPNSEKLLLDLYFPKDDTTSCLRPLVIFVHGGGFHEGNRKKPTSSYLH